MTRIRFATYSLGLLLFILLGTSLYIYYNLPSLLAQQARYHLSEIGVIDASVKDVRYSTGRFGADRLLLHGKYEGFTYAATLSALEVDYNWRSLLAGRLRSVSLSGLDLSIEQVDSGSATDAGPVIVNLDEALPLALFDALPLQSLHIHEWHLDYSAPDRQLLTVTGSLLLKKDLELKFETNLAGSAVTGSLKARSRPATANLDVSLHGKGSDTLHLTAVLERKNDNEWVSQIKGQTHYAPLLEWLGRLDAETDLLDMAALGDVTLSGYSELSAQVRHPNAFTVDMTAGLTFPMQVSADMHLRNTIERLDYPALIKDFKGDTDINLGLSADSVDVVMQPTELRGNLSTGVFPITKESLKWLRWTEGVPFHFENGDPLKVTIGNNHWAPQLNNTQLTLGNKQSRLTLQNVHFNTSLTLGEQSLLDSNLTLSLKTRLRDKQLPQLELTFSQQGSLESNTFVLEIDDTAESFNTSMKGKLNLAQGGGEYRLNAHSRDLPYFTDTVTSALRHFGLLQQKVELLAGTLDLTTTGKGDDFELANWKQRSQLTIDGVSGNLEEYRFDDLDLLAHWTGIERWQTVQPFELSLARLDAGFEVRDLQVSLSLPKPTPIQQPRVRMDHLSAGIFGGQLYLPEPHPWDFGATSNNVTLEAEGWQLADIVSLQENENIQAQGTLEGKLPVTVTQGRIIIEKGYLRALPPGGRIRYVANEASQALASGSPELQMTLDLLNNFQYQVLSSAVELDNDGILLLALSLAGSNPTREGGRPVNFNINLQQNLDPLLQSLRLSDRLVEQIESGLQ